MWLFRKILHQFAWNFRFKMKNKIKCGKLGFKAQTDGFAYNTLIYQIIEKGIGH